MNQHKKVQIILSRKRASQTGFKRVLLLTLPRMLRNLFPNFATWVTRTGTAPIEFLNVWALLGFGLVMLLNEQELLQISAYKYFTSYPPTYTWLAMIAIGLIQAYLMFKPSPASDQVGGIFLGISSIIWFIIAGTFGINYPPVSTALPIWSVVGILTGSGGYALLNSGKEREILEDSRSQ